MGESGLNAFSRETLNKRLARRFNRTVRYEWLTKYAWTSIEEVQSFATQWMWSYNHYRLNLLSGRQAIATSGHCSITNLVLWSVDIGGGTIEIFHIYL